ncbi:MAG: flagellar basal body rod protein FlgB [Nitrospiraceae bacterium]|jgi:flagellar basal-body rod protein FlgB|nr:MAG: flagellar basal body rod protein FlgB [Nitrospiraceae bacterium]
MDKEMTVLQRIIQSANIRQKVISSNIANADTPGYKSKDVHFGDLLKNNIKLLTTNPGHVKKPDDNGINSTITVNNDPGWGDRNNVLLNSEMAKMTENSLTHDAAVKLLNAKIKMFRSAIRTK